MKLSLLSSVCAFLQAASGCSKSPGTILGQAPGGKPETILAVQAGDTASQVTLTGIMIEKCPTAGCWFRLKDSTGIIKVDTKAAGFAVVDVPLEKPIVVAGKVASEGEETILDATGLRF